MFNTKRAVLAVGLIGSIGASPAALASTVNINDTGPDSGQPLSLSVNFPGQPTDLNFAPGGGNPIDIITPTESNGVTSIDLACPQGNCVTETLNFKFDGAHHQPQASSGFYLYFTEGPGNSSISDLFVFQTIAGRTEHYIGFSSADNLTGNIQFDVINQLIRVAEPPGPSGWTNLGTVPETGGWQLAFNTGTDQYYIMSDVEAIPEPASFVLMALGLAGLGFSLRRKSA